MSNALEMHTMTMKLIANEFSTLFKQTKTELKLKKLQRRAQRTRWIDDIKVQEIISRFSNDRSPAIRGELCYLLGRWGKRKALPILLGFLKDDNEYVRSQASEALSRLREIMDKQEETELLAEEHAFQKIKHRLLEEYAGQFAGFYKGELIAIRPNKLELMQAVEDKIGHVRYYIRRISEELTKVNMPRPR